MPGRNERSGCLEMTMRSHLRVVMLATIGLLLAASLGAAAYAATRPSVSSANTDVVRTRTAAKSLGGQDDYGKYYTVLSVTLPKGSWVITANATASNFGMGDSVTCRIYRGSAVVASVETIVSASNGLAGLNPIASFGSSTSQSVSLRCSHEGLHDGITIDAGAVLWAHRSSSLNAS